MSLTKISYTKDWTNPSDFPTIETSEATVRSDIQNLYDQVKTGVNTIVDELEGTSAAGNIGITPISGVSGANVQAALANLKTQIDTKETIANVTAGLALKENLSAANQLVKTITFESSTGKFTITTQGGTVTYIDTNLEKVPGSMALVEDPVGSGTYYLVIYDVWGVETSRCAVTTLFNAIEVENTATINLTLSSTSTGKKKLTANVIDGSITATKLESSIMSTIQGYATSAANSASAAASSATTAGQYKDSAASSASSASGSASTATTQASEATRQASSASTSATSAATYANNASTSANNASTSASTASSKATLSQSWAVGGTGTRSGEDINNSKYWAEQAAEIAGGAGTMQKLQYDPNIGGVENPVLTAGGIVAYQEAHTVALDTSTEGMVAMGIDSTGYYLRFEE